MPPRTLAEWVAAHRHELAVHPEPGKPGRFFIGYPSKRPEVTPFEYWQRDMPEGVARLILDAVLRIRPA